MKKIFLLLFASLFSIGCFAQSNIRYAPVASPHFTGTPLAPTPTTSDNSTKVATTAYAQNLLTANAIFFESGLFGGSGTSGSPFTFISKANTFTSLNTFNISNLLTGFSDAIFINNPTLTTSSNTLQNSPNLDFGGGQWNIGTTADNRANMRMYLQPTTTATLFNFRIDESANGGGFANVLNLNSFGSLSTSNYTAISSNAGGATSTLGVGLTNTTASTSGVPIQNSTILLFHGSNFNTGSTTANYFDVKLGARGVGGATPTSSFVIGGSQGTSSTTPTYVDLVSIDVASGNTSLQIGNLITKGTASAINSTATATGAQIAGGIITSTSAAATTITLPTAGQLATQLGITTFGHFEFSIYNTAGANTVTIALGSNMTALTTLTGENTLTIPSGTGGFGRFALDFSSSTVCTISRIE